MSVIDVLILVSLWIAIVGLAGLILTLITVHRGEW